MNAKLIVFCLVLLLSFNFSKAQPWLKRNDSIQVSLSGVPIRNPWVGGLNYCQFSEIDLNLDGIKDLFVFDRTGNRISTFINKGSANKVDYYYAPEYATKFPPLHDWVLLRDYNCDGKEDIFGYSDIGGSVKVYRNDSNPIDGLKFTLVSPAIYSDYHTGSPLYLYISSVDVPSITDIDGDGDIDIVTMVLGGTSLEYHQNQSKQLYGTCDSLTFVKQAGCWGDFTESFSSNVVSLGVSCRENTHVGYDTTKIQSAHSGSCQLCLQLNGHPDKDLILGALGYPSMNGLINGGDSSSANMISQDIHYPSTDVSVNLNSFPCAYNVDVNNDGLKDLLVCPNSIYVENLNSVWYYQNVGTNALPVFKHQQNNFLQDNMIETGEGAYPVFFDYNADGLMDLLIGNYGYYANTGYTSEISLYQNTGTLTTPKFDLVTRDFASLSTLGINNLVPAFGDLNGDGAPDMMLGAEDGTLIFYKNTAASGSPANFVLSKANFTDATGAIIDVGDFCAPQIIDIDRDGKNDLLIGARNGKLTYYRNTGTLTNPSFTLVSRNFGNIQIQKSGYILGFSYPFMFDLAGVHKMIVGSENGFLYYYDHIDGNLSGTFNLLDSMYQHIWEGVRTAPNGADVNNDGLMDMVVGNYSGGVAFYQGQLTNPFSGIETHSNELFNYEFFPNPASRSITIRLKNNGNRQTITLAVYNLVGEKLLEQQLVSGNSQADVQVNLENFRDGMYLLSLGNSNGKTVKKLILQH